APACVRRRQRLHGVADPAAGGLGKIEITIDAIDDALAAECGQPLIDLLADRTEFRISGVAEREHTEFNALKARRALAHQLFIGTDRPCRRFALAPRGGDENEP